MLRGDKSCADKQHKTPSFLLLACMKSLTQIYMHLQIFPDKQLHKLLEAHTQWYYCQAPGPRLQSLGPSGREMAVNN